MVLGLGWPRGGVGMVRKWKWYLLTKSWRFLVAWPLPPERFSA